MSAALPPPPAGGDVSRGPQLLACIWTPVPFTIFLLATRLYVRFRISGMGIDDYLMLAAWVLYIVTFAIETANILEGGTRHLYYLASDPDLIVRLLKLTWVTFPIGVMSSALGKCSVAFLLRRIIGPNSVWRKWALFISTGLYFTTSVISSFLPFLQCKPSSAIWEGQGPGVKCWDPNIVADFDLYQSSFGAGLDFFLALLPISIVWGLQLDMKKRIATCILLGLGVFAGICAAVKTSDLRNPIAIEDFTWSTYDIWIWTSLEISLVIICGCIPTLKPLWDQIFNGKMMGGGTSKNSKYSYGSKGSSGYGGSKGAYALQSANSARFGHARFNNLSEDRSTTARGGVEEDYPSSSEGSPRGSPQQIHPRSKDIRVQHEVSVHVASDDDTAPLKYPGVLCGNDGVACIIF